MWDNIRMKRKETLQSLASQTNESTREQLIHREITDYNKPMGHFFSKATRTGFVNLMGTQESS